MISRYFYALRRYSRRLWVRVTLIAALSFVAALITPLLAPLIPIKLAASLGAEKVRALFDILVNSMLAVTTFSVTIMVTAHFNASAQVSPRAHRVLREDSRTQTVLATFIGAFVFALTGIVMLQLGLASEDTFPVLYLTTLLVIALVVVAIIRWISHLSSLGSLEETTRKIEAAARETLDRRVAHPFLGGRRMPPAPDIPDRAHKVAATASGFVQNIDIAALNAVGENSRGIVWLRAQPGDWLGEGDTLAYVDVEAFDDEIESKVAMAVTLGDTATFGQDVAFGVRVLAEIAERALSPAMNDPRTATDVIARLVTLFERWQEEIEPEEPTAPHVFVAPADVYRMVEMGFDPIARDAGQFVEVQTHLQVACARLSGHRAPEMAEAARIMSARALSHADAHLALEADIARIRALAVARNPVSRGADAE